MNPNMRNTPWQNGNSTQNHRNGASDANQVDVETLFMEENMTETAFLPENQGQIIQSQQSANPYGNGYEGMPGAGQGNFGPSYQNSGFIIPGAIPVGTQNQNTEKPRRRLPLILSVVGGVAVLAIVLSSLSSLFVKKPASEPPKTPTETINETNVSEVLEEETPVTLETETEEPVGQETLSLPEEPMTVQPQWSEWETALPASLDTALYVLEEKIQYRSVPLYVFQDISEIGSGYTIYEKRPPVADEVNASQDGDPAAVDGENTVYLCYRADEWTDYRDDPIRPDTETLVNVRTLYRYRQLEEGFVPASSMDNFVNFQASGYAFLSDVKTEDWFSAYVENAVSLGAILPNEFLQFQPKEGIMVSDVIRAAAVLHWIYSGEPGFFSERDIIDYAIHQEIIESDDYSDYEAFATRADVAYILGNALPISELTAVNNFETVNDLNPDSKYFKSVSRLAKAGVISWPSPSSDFYPGNTATRAETATFVCRLAFPQMRAIY